MARDYYKSVNIATKEYLKVLGASSYALYFYLLYASTTKLDDKYNLEDVSKDTGIDMLEIENNLLKLKACKLVSVSGKDEDRIIKIKKISLPSTAEKIEFIEKFYKKELVTEEERDQLLDKVQSGEAMASPIIHTKKKTSLDGSLKRVNLERGVSVNPNTALAIVHYWYDTLNKVFKTNNQYFSPRIDVESHMIKEVMSKFGDSYDDTRKIIDFIIDEAQKKDKIDAVSTMSLYSRLRNKAHYRVFVKPEKKEEDKFSNKKKLHQVDGAVQEMVGIYNHFTKNGKSKDYIINKIIKPKSDEITFNEFLKAIGE